MAASASRTRRTAWWHAYVAALVILILIDIPLRAWVPHPLRLPEQFSAAYLERYVAWLRTVRDPVIVMGDSALWGYKISATDAAPSLLARALPTSTIVNLSYEGGSPVNSEVLLRYLLQRGIRPRLVIFNVNQKEFNPADSAFKRLRPSLQIAAQITLTVSDRTELEFQDRSGINSRLSELVDHVSALYRYRTDLREAIFGTDDLATFIANAVATISGYASRQAREEAPTAERFLGTYDLTPLTQSNLSFRRLTTLAVLIEREHLPAIAILTPTNHALLHDYIDNPVYAANLAITNRILRNRGERVLNLDSAFSTDEFIDNDHLTARGNIHFAAVLRPAVERALK